MLVVSVFSDSEVQAVVEEEVRQVSREEETIAPETKEDLEAPRLPLAKVETAVGEIPEDRTAME